MFEKFEYEVKEEMLKDCLYIFYFILQNKEGIGEGVSWKFIW